MSARRRKNPDTLTLALGVGAVGLLVAGGVWWYVSQREEASGTVRLPAVTRTFDKKSAKASAAAAVAARGGKRVGVPFSSLKPGETLRAGPRYQPSDVSEPVTEETSSDGSDLTQPLDASAGVPT